MHGTVGRVRIVSLIPSATEIAFALGLGDQVVGVTFECDHPPDPRVGRAVVVGGLDTHGLDAAGIDALVRTKVEAGELLYTLDEATFRALEPDVVLTQDLCRVCALPSGQVDEAMVRLGCAATVVTMDPHTIDGVLATITEVGAVTGAIDDAEVLVGSLRARLDAVALAVAGRVRRRVFVLEWPDPPFVAGHWVPELVQVAVAEAVLARPGERSVPTTWDDIAAARPDVVVVSSCGCEMWAIDANGLMVRPGPRLVDGVETLAALLHGIAELDPRTARRIR